jgi:hypothetical protein
MMIHTDFPLMRRSFKASLTIIAGMAIVFGCGGGGGGGAGSTEPTGNQIPTAEISAPAGTYFKEGENITFSGSGTDDEDGDLNGGSLVWTSNIDGTLGTGSTVITNALAAGDHEITLAATDSAGQTYITEPALQIHIEQTRFIKVGSQTAGVTDASNAFDGDYDTAATIMTPDTEFIHFKANTGSADTFIFKMKLGVSTSGSKLTLQGLSSTGEWQLVGEYGLDSDRTVKVTISNAQDYLDAEDYINLRVFWEGGADDDNAPVYEIWRIDPPYAGPQTQGVDNAVLAFDADPSTAATILQPLGSGSGSILHLRAFIGSAIADRFAFEILLNDIGEFQYLSFDIKNLATSDWETIASLELNTTAARNVSIPITSDYLDADGYISLRAYWANVSSGPPPASVSVYEIKRIDSFYMDPRTSFGLIQYAENAADQDWDTYAIMHNYWGEKDRYDTLNVVAYLGDVSAFTFSIKTAQSLNGYTSELIIEGENSPDAWSEIDRIPLTQDSPGTDVIELSQAWQYVNADGWLSLRVRWEDHSEVLEPLVNGYIYEIWPGAD